MLECDHLLIETHPIVIDKETDELRLSLLETCASW